MQEHQTLVCHMKRDTRTERTGEMEKIIQSLWGDV